MFAEKIKRKKTQKQPLAKKEKNFFRCFFLNKRKRSEASAASIYYMDLSFDLLTLDLFG
jgi:hypothetical protein